jgi:DNA-binding beta-propeller fold protein YncE
MRVSRNSLILLIILGILASAGLVVWKVSSGTSTRPDRVWGRKGVLNGDFARPRAAALDPKTGHLFIVDFTARIQCYDLEGEYLGVTWTTPDFRNGRPSGLGIDREGNLLVADSHYHCVRVYDHQGQELKVLGGQSGDQPGFFGYVSDCVQDADGFYYISEFGQNDRITKLDPEGKFVAVFGSPGQGRLQFSRVRALALGPDGLLYCADACNHRIQVLTRGGEFVREFGTAGSGNGELSYPYDLAFNARGELYVVERGNHRVQKFDPTSGQSLGTWGGQGRGPGQFADPWALVVDSSGRIHVIDTENHRVQRIKF